jgi:hypothetical protein
MPFVRIVVCFPNRVAGRLDRPGALADEGARFGATVPSAQTIVSGDRH